jgi:2-amino-4-hydroxy-6-hydroxymethyldihydropteridine diphosphokinase
MPDCWIGVGANLGDARSAFTDAWMRLVSHPGVRPGHHSGIYSTRPVGALAGNTFSNAAFSIVTTLSPIAVLDALQQIENELGRVRDVRWGPRPIDLDLLFVDQLVLNEPRLIVPHPAAWYRRFVLHPLAEINPRLRHPVLEQTIGDLISRLDAKPLTIAFDDASAGTVARVQPELVATFPEIQFVLQRDLPEAASVAVRLDITEPAGPLWDGVPVANLTETPGDPEQRLIDFCASIFDTPHRTGDWSLPY